MLALPLLLLALPHACTALITLPSIFTDGAVLQTREEYGARAYVYGWAEPAEVVTVNFALAAAPPSRPPVNYTAVADATGYFIVTLDPLSEAAFSLAVSGSVSANTVVVKDCVGGDVYLCGGQSNQCFDAESAFPPGPALAAQTYPNVRLFSVAMQGGAQPQRDFAPAAGAQCTWNHDKDNATRCNAWLPSTPANNAHFSAVCLFTALQVMRNHSGARPVGLIYSAFGGTSLSLWAPPAVYDGCPGAMAPKPPPGSLWNAMINPLVHYTVRSVLFFQGEQDAGAEAATPGWYACRFQRLIAHWRSAWGTGDYAFNYVQLGPVDPGSPSTAYGALRIAQGLAQPRPGGATDTTGMAAAYDLGDASSPYDSVHFRNKVEVGRRLAAAVLHTAFAQQYPAVNWAPPAVAPAVPDGPPPFSSLALALASEDGSGAALVDGGQCTECCARGAGSLVQLRQGAGAWVNASTVALAAGGRTLRVTAPAPGNWSELRLAALNYPQCALVGGGNGFPVPAQLVAVGAAAAAAAAPAPAAVAAVEQGQRSGAGSLQWRGRTYAWQGDEALPPVGLNTWNAYHTNVDEVLVLAVGQALVSLGLREVGWQLVGVDDGWQVARNASGYIIEDPARFPSGFGALAAGLHALGLRAGLYTSQSSLTCQDRPGSYTFEAQDAASYCAFGMDYLKVDHCGGTQYSADNTSWIKFRAGLDACAARGGRKITLSVESCTAAQNCGWVAALADLWRCSGDIQATWRSVLGNLDAANANAAVAVPGHYNDADLLVCGLPGVTLAECQSQLGAWAVVASPLLLSLDLTAPQPAALLALLLNAEVLGVSQDASRVQGVRVSAANASGTECWAKPLAPSAPGGGGGGAPAALAVLLLNRGDAPADAACSWAELGLAPGATAAVRDLWAHQALPDAVGSVAAAGIEPHASRLLRLTLA